MEPGLAVSQIQAGTLCEVNPFWEKPALSKAQALLQSGCLRNTFITIGSAATLPELVCSEVPAVPLSLRRALAENDLMPTYSRLPNVDFPRDFLAHQPKRLSVLRDSGSGWANSGSSNRVPGLLAKNVNQPAWFPQTTALRHKSVRCEKSCDSSGNPHPRCFSRSSPTYWQDPEISIFEISGISASPADAHAATGGT